MGAELEDERRRGAEVIRGLATVGRQLDELRVAARGQATRMRLRALREAAELSSQIAAADRAGAADERLLAAVERAVERIGTEWDEEEREEQVRVPVRGTAAEPRPGANGNGAGPGRAGMVSFDIGPVRDFSQLVRFEDAANAIGATGEISIKRFSEGRARIDVSLREPVDILRELEERCDLDFEVRSTGDDEIILDFGD